jgi:hypothetical protein
MKKPVISYCQLVVFLLPPVIGLGYASGPHVLSALGYPLWGQNRELFYLIGVMLTMCAFFVFVYFAARKRIGGVASILSAVAVFYLGSFLIRLCEPWIESVQAHYYAHYYAACISLADELANGDRLGICEKSNADVEGYADVIFYDSGDKFLLPRDQRPSSWKSAAMKLLPDIMEWNEKFLFITPLGGHFYFVKIDIGAVEGPHFL